MQANYGSVMPPERNDLDNEDSLRSQESSQYKGDQPFILMEVLLAFLKRPWILLLSMVAVTIPATLYLFTLPLMYQSQAVVSTPQISMGSSMGLDPILGQNSKGRDENYFISILESNAYKDKITQRILSARPELQSSSDSIKYLVKKNLNYAKKSRIGGFFAIIATARSAEFAKFMADIAVESFENITVELRRRETNLVAIFVEKQIESLNSSLAENESQIQSFLESRNMGYGDLAQGVDTELRTLQANFAQAQTERDLSKLQIETYTAQLNERVTNYLSNNRDTDESNRLKQLNQELNRLTALSADSLVQRDTLKFATLQRNRQDVLHQLAALVSGQDQGIIEGNAPRASVKSIEEVLQQSFIDFESAQIRCNYFQYAIEVFIRNNPDLPKDILEYFNLVRTKNVLQKTIDILVEMREKTRIQLASETGGIEVLDYPAIPDGPVSQRRGFKTLMAIFASVIIGLLLSFGIDRFDNTVQGEADLQSRFNLPIYGSIPVLDAETNKKARRYSKRKDNSKEDMPSADAKRLNFYSESSPIAESYHSIKTAVEFTKRDRGSKSFVITSPVASDGKSLTSYNLGVSFAHGGARVLLIDADLRRASQHKLFECPRTPGFTDFLNEKNTFEECLVKSTTEGLFFLPAGSHVSNPAALLSSHLVREFLDDVEQKFDLVLIDTPPITPCMDSRHLALLVGGGLILVVRAEKTKINILEHSINLLYRANVEILGVIVNHASFRYGYGYYYMYQYYNPYGYYYSGYYYYYHQNEETGDKEKKKRKRSGSAEKGKKSSA